MSQLSPADNGDTFGGNTFTIEEALAHIGFGRTQVLMFIFVGIGTIWQMHFILCSISCMRRVSACWQWLTDRERAAWAGDGMEAMLLSYLGPEV